MSFTFREPGKFWRETAAVTVAAAAAGAAAPIVAPLLGAALPIEAAAGAAALFGGSIAAALTRMRPLSTLLRGVIGVFGGGLAAMGFAALATRFGLGFSGLLAGGALGGLALGTLLASDDDGQGRGAQQSFGVLLAMATGTIGAAAIAQIAAFTSAEGTSAVAAGATMAGALGLWVAAAAGLRRVERVRDELLVRADALAAALADPVKARLVEGIATFHEIEAALLKDELMGPATLDEARKNARALLGAVVETATTWMQIHDDLGSPRLASIEDRLKDLAAKEAATTDAVTLSHLARAGQALNAQKSAIEGLRVGRERAEAAVDAQTALLERLRLAVAQHRASDRERFAVELSAVSDQVSRLSDDLESISAAIAEAEAFPDRRLLADLERVGRRALHSVDAPKEGENEHQAEVVELDVAAARRR